MVFEFGCLHGKAANRASRYYSANQYNGSNVISLAVLLTHPTVVDGITPPAILISNNSHIFDKMLCTMYRTLGVRSISQGVQCDFRVSETTTRTVCGMTTAVATTADLRCCCRRH
jgi:hypothetical protein